MRWIHQTQRFQSTPPAEAEGDDAGPARSRSTSRVSIHSPRRSGGRPGLGGIEQVLLIVSIHSPRRSGGRPATAKAKAKPAKFQSTPPAEAEGDDRAHVLEIGVFGVSIHSPRRSGGRPASGYASQLAASGFQSTPPAEAEGDVPATAVAWLSVFQSTPPAEAEGDPARMAEKERRVISFNPLPPPKRRETALIAASVAETSCFNPLPPPKRRETAHGSVGQLLLPDVSIHSPRRSGGRLPFTPSTNIEDVFQSTPPAEAEGDDPGSRSASGQSSFNPLPPPKRRETGVLRDGELPLEVSIHSPRRSGGRLAAAAAAIAPFIVSIHSPRRSGGRRPSRRQCSQRGCFNPLPPPKRRETSLRRALHRSRLRCFNPLPPPKRRETCATCSRATRWPPVSIHSPRRSGGRLACWWPRPPGRTCFNPLPPPKRRETTEGRRPRG